MKFRKLIQNCSRTFVLLTAALVLKPSSIKNHHFVSTFQILSIQSSKDQPPRIALTEINLDPQVESITAKNYADQINLNEIKIGKGPLQKQVKKISMLAPIKISRADFMAAATQPKTTSAPRVALASEPVIAIRAPAGVPEKMIGGNKKYNISGSVELSDGLSFGPDEYFEVRKVVDGVPQELGKVDVKNGVFSIPTDDVNKGTVSIELKDKDGETLGQGFYHLASNGAPAKVIVNPTPSTASGHFVTIYKMPTSNPTISPSKTTIALNTSKVKGEVVDLMNASTGETTKTDKSGGFEIKGIHRNSWTLLRTDSEDYYPGIYIQGNKERNTPMFPTKMIDALKDIVKQQRPYSAIPENGSVVWGQILQNGRPVKGVSIQAEISEDYKPVYFNALMLPDAQLTETSDNGLFAIMNLPEGWQSIVAQTSNKYFSHASTIVDENNVSYVEMQSSLEKEIKDVQVFDALSGEKASAEIFMQTLATPLQVDGSNKVYLPPIHRISMVKVSPSDSKYLESYQEYSDDDQLVQIPLVEAAWMQNLKTNANISSMGESATVIGLVQGDDFTVMPTPNLANGTAQVVYFDYQGEIIPSGQAGGGFAIFGVQTQVNSVVIKSERTQKIYSQLIPLDTGMTAVLKYNFN